jgi:hypothetical protein
MLLSKYFYNSNAGVLWKNCKMQKNIKKIFNYYPQIQRQPLLIIKVLHIYVYIYIYIHIYTSFIYF